MTDEQIALICEHVGLDNPQVKTAEVYADPGYEDAEKTLTTDDRAVKAKLDPEMPNIDL